MIGWPLDEKVDGPSRRTVAAVLLWPLEHGRTHCDREFGKNPIWVKPVDSRVACGRDNIRAAGNGTCDELQAKTPATRSFWEYQKH